MNSQNRTDPRAYIFDYGGTLDTGGHHWGRVLWHGYEAERVPVGEADFRAAYVCAERTLAAQPLIAATATFHDTLSLKLRLQMEQLNCMAYHEAVLRRLYEQTREHTRRSIAVLRELHSRVPLVLVSNFYGNIHTVLTEFGFDGLFRSVIESAVVGVRKPDPRIFTLGVEALGLPAGDVTVVGDSWQKDILPAQAAGCRAVWMRGEQWEEGACPSSPSVRVITDLNELL